MKMKTKQIYIGLAILVVLGFLYYMFGMKRISGFEDGQTFTLYYASWCPHCKDIKPVFKKYSQSGSVTVKGKTVFVSMVEEKQIKSDVKVKGFPSFILQKADGTTIESDAERTPDGWTQWLGENV